MLESPKFPYFLIYSEKLDEMAIGMKGFAGVPAIETQRGKLDSIDSHKYFDSGQPWITLEVWYE